MWIDRQDLLYAVRSARRAPLLSAIAIVALSLGIGLNAGVFALLNTLFLDAPTRTNPATFVQLFPRYEGWFTGAGQFSSFTTEDYEAIRTQARALEDVAASQPSSAVLGQGPGHVAIEFTSCNYLHVFGIDRPLLGRFLSPGECARGTADQLAVISEYLWRSRFSADPRMVGKTIHLNGLPFQVIGIVSADDANVLMGGVFVPYTVQPLLVRGYNALSNVDSPWLNVTGRLRQGYSRADAQAELTTILRRQDRAYVQRKITPFNRRTTVVLTNGSFIANPAMHDLVMVLMALILGPLSLVLMLACTNVTMLFLSRAIVRRGEIAVRLALGVGRARLVRMLVLESLLMAAIAGAISVAFAYRVPILIMSAVANGDEAGFTPAIHPDWRVFAYLTVLVTVATLLSSLAPMRAAWKLDLITTLKGQEGAATMRSRTTSGLIIAQIAMSFVMLTAAVLFARLPGMVTAMDPGFETRHTLSLPLDVDTTSNNRTNALQFYRALEARILAIPGVQSLAFETLQPFRQTAPSEIRLPHQEKGQGKPATVDDVSKDFMATFGIQLVAGRDFSSSDQATSTNGSVALVSEAFAREFWPRENPLGKVVTTTDDKRYAVVGVAADTRSERFGILDGPRLYTLRDPSSLNGQMYVRFTGSASTAESAVGDAVRALDPTQVETPQTIWERLEQQASSIRSLARIILVMASIAVMLAVTGVYGVLSFAINRRTREFGIRMVLGANRVSIFRSIMLRGGRQIALGLMIGIALAEPAAWMFGTLLKRSPFPLRNFDPLIYAIAAALLVLISLAAMYLPAMRATRVDPMKALRTE